MGIISRFLSVAPPLPGIAGRREPDRDTAYDRVGKTACVMMCDAASEAGGITIVMTSGILPL
jgi:hypothetical protein